MMVYIVLNVVIICYFVITKFTPAYLYRRHVKRYGLSRYPRWMQDRLNKEGGRSLLYLVAFIVMISLSLYPAAIVCLIWNSYVLYQTRTAVRHG